MRQSLDSVDEKLKNSRVSKSTWSTFTNQRWVSWEETSRNIKEGFSRLSTCSTRALRQVAQTVGEHTHVCMYITHTTFY